jgi:hypothetical protein
MFLLRTQMDFYQEIRVFLQLSWIGLFATKWPFLILQTADWKALFLLKTNNSQREASLLMLLCLILMVFFQEIHMFLQLSWIGLFGTKCVFLPLQILIGRQYSFQKLTQLSQGNKVLYALSSNIDAFLLCDTCVSIIQLNGSIWN